MNIPINMKSLIKVMKALSDPNRVKIVKMLQQRDLCVCEINKALDITQPSVSKHMKILEEADLVQRHKDGQWVNYILNDDESNTFISSLLENIEDSLKKDPEIEALEEIVPTLDRNQINK